MKTEREEKSFVDIFDIDFDKFADETPEEIVSEDTPDSVEEEEVEDPVEEEGESEKGAEKQAENEEESSEEESEEDASADDNPVTEPVGEFDELIGELTGDNILDFDEEKEYSMDKDGLKELIEETVQKKSTEAIEEFKESLGNKGKDLLTVLEKGGSVDDFISMETQIDFNNVSLSDGNGNPLVQNQKYLIEDLMKINGYDEETIQETIADYADAGLLEKQAKIAKKKLADWQEKQNEAKLAAKEEERRLEQERMEQEADAFKNDVLSTTEIAGFEIGKKKAKKLYDYITKADNEGVTPFQKDDTAENRLLYAYFAMEGFDKEKLTKSIATEQTRTLKKKINRYKDQNAAPKRSGGEVRRTNQETPKIGDMWSIV